MAQTPHQELVSEFQKLASGVDADLLVRRKLQTQLTENMLVKAEMDRLDDAKGHEVFKQLGPALLRVDLDEAKEQVDSRLRLLNEEIQRVDQRVRAKEGRQSEISKIMEGERAKVEAEATQRAQSAQAEVEKMKMEMMSQQQGAAE